MTYSQTTPKNERVVFLGDSITQQGAGPTGYVTLVRQAVEKSSVNGNNEIIGAGISGNKVPDLLARLDKDVLSKKPTLVVIYIGINDVWHSIRNNGTPKEAFELGLRELVKRINTAGARVILCTPSVIGEKTDGSNDLDAMLTEYSEISRNVAAETESELLDLRSAFLNELKSRNPDNRHDGILTGDGVHLNDAGNQFVADQMLAALSIGAKLDAKKPAGGKPALLRHIVLFKFVDGLAEEKVREVVDAFAMLPKKIETIAEFEMGTNISPENLAQGYTHGFMVSFRTKADCDAYLPHPAHQEFVQLLEGRIDGVLVFDFVDSK